MKLDKIAACGAEVSGVNLGEEIPESSLLEIQQNLAKYGVLFFRDQALTGEQLVSFSKRFGKPFIQPALAEKYDELLIIETDKNKPAYLNTFHQDMTGLPEPPGAHFLHAIVVPEGGGDTIWSCCHGVYEALSSGMQRMLGEMTATHSLLHYYARIFSRWSNGAEKYREFQEKYPPVHHPVIRTHPTTGRKGVFVNPFFTVKIDDVSKSESTTLLNFLYQEIAKPEYCARLRWQVGTLAIWDNRSTNHYAVADYYPQRRKMQRASVCGENPI
ncbi:MAG: TauD/TfdA family dioxygenase [Pseudomonadota bacterium]